MAQGSFDHILVDIFFPAAGKAYEVRVPRDLRIHELTRLVSKLFEEMEPGSYSADGTAVLCDRKSGNIFRSTLTPREAGWENGTQLLFI